MIDSGDTEKARHYITDNLNFLDEKNQNIVNSGNPVIDAVLQEKVIHAKNENIKTDISIKFSEKIEIDEFDLGIILGNALDNAIEACMKVTGEKMINISLITSEDRISVKIQNTVEKYVNTENLLTTKGDKKKHGLGIKSMKTLAEKYEGVVNFKCENNIFTLVINMINTNK